MAHPFEQSAPQFAGTYLPWPQPNLSQHHPGFPPNPLAHRYPLTGHYLSHGQSPYNHLGQPELLQPQSSVQVLSQELVAAQRKLLQYTDLISSLYVELEKIRNAVCHNCKERISPANLAQQPSVFAPIVSFDGPGLFNTGSQRTAPIISPPPTIGSYATFPFPSPDGHSFSQAVSLDTQLTTPRPASPILCTISQSPSSNVPTPSEHTEIILLPSATPCTKPPVDFKKPQWSVKYNPGIEKVLDITFVHAFQHSSPVYSVRFSPDGNFLAAGLDYGLGRTHIYDLHDKSMTCSLAEFSDYARDDDFPPRGVWCVCFSPDGRYLVVGCSFQMIYIWDIASKRLLASFKGHTDAVRSLDISPDGRLLVTGSNDCSVRVWKMRDGSSKLLSTGGGLFTSVRFSPNGRFVAGSNLDRFLRIWDVRSGQLVGMWNDHEGSIRCIAFTPDGEELVSGCWDGMIRSWNVGSLKSLTRSGLSPGKRKWEPGIVAKRYERLEFDRYTGGVRSVAISSNGKWVATGPSDKYVSIWDMHTAMQQCTLEGHIEVLSSVDFSAVGNYIAAGSADGFLTLWRYETV